MTIFCGKSLSLLGVLLSVSLSAQAFRSSKYESFTDPDYVGYRPKSIVIQVFSEDMEQRVAIEKKLTSTFSKYGVSTLIFKALFPPTRNWQAEEIAKTLKEKNIDAALVVSAGNSSSNVIQYGVQTFSHAQMHGTASTYGSGTTFNANASGTSTSVALLSVRSNALFSAAIFDLNAERVAWYIDIKTKAGGLLFVGGERDGKAAAGKIEEALKKDGHLIKPQKK